MGRFSIAMLEECRYHYITMLNDLLFEMNPWWREPGTRLAGAQPFARRHLEAVLRSLGSGERGIVLLGPRQVGKTVLLKQAIEVLLGLRPSPLGEPAPGLPPQNVTFASFDDDRITADLSLRDVQTVKPPGVDDTLPRFFFFDEISRVPRWDQALKQAIDHTRHGPDQKDHRIAASDSAASLLGKGRIESGQGRWDEIEVESWTFREFLALAAPAGDPPENVLLRFPNALELYLARGGFPAHAYSAASTPEVHERLRADIVDVAIYKDLARQGIDADRARRFFVFLAQESGAEQNLNDRSVDLDADKRSLEGWLALLQAGRLIRRLDRYAASHKAASRLKPISKYFVADHGLVAALSVGRRDSPPADERVIETVVYRHLRELPRARLWYFRDRKGECDFVVEDEDGVTAIEVTTADPARHGKLERFRETAARLGARRSLVIHSGLEQEERSGIALLPLHRFLLDPSLAVRDAGGGP